VLSGSDSNFLEKIVVHSTKSQALKRLVPLLSLLGTLAVNATPVSIDTLNLAQFPSFGDGNVQSGIQSAITAWNATHDPDLPSTGIGATSDIKLNQAEVVAGFPTFGTGTLQISLPMGEYNYLFLHWGGPNVDVFYQNPQLYYIGGEAGSLTFTAPVYSEQIPVVYFTSGSRAGQIKKAAGVVNHQYGLSFYSFYSEIPVITPTPVDPPSTSLPDSGTSVVLLGAGLAGIVGLRRSWARRS